MKSGSRTGPIDRSASAVIPLGFNPSNLGPLIGALLSHGSTSSIPGITPQILGAAMGGMASAQAYAFRITWFAFLPASKLLLLFLSLALDVS
jgi:hypothetical protein